MLSACDSPSTYAISRSCDSRSSSVWIAIVGANSSRAAYRRLGDADVDEQHVATAQQLGGGTEHRVNRRHPGARAPERLEPLAQRALERADVEHDAPRRSPRETVEDLGRHSQRSGDDHEIVVDCRCVDVGHVATARDRSRGIGDVDREALRGEEADEPAPHLPGATDHERALPGAAPSRLDTLALLHGERRADQREQQLLGERRRHCARSASALGALEDPRAPDRSHASRFRAAASPARSPTRARAGGRPRRGCRDRLRRVRVSAHRGSSCVAARDIEPMSSSADTQRLRDVRIMRAPRGARGRARDATHTSPRVRDAQRTPVRAARRTS